MFNSLTKFTMKLLGATALVGTGLAIALAHPSIPASIAAASVVSASGGEKGDSSSTSVANKAQESTKRQGADLVQKAPREATAVLAETPSGSGREPVDIYANFKKYYREPTGYTQAANVDLQGLGTVVALSLGGFLPSTANGTTITITEIVVVDQDGAVLSGYKVRRVNYLGQSATAVPSIGTGSAANNYGLEDDVFAPNPANSLSATNVAANTAFSIEIELQQPKVLSEIRVAQAIPLTAAGTTVLGSVGVLTTNAAYRLYNYATPTDLPAGTGTGVTFVLGRTTAPLRWVKFSELGEPTYAYVLVPRTDLADAYWLNRKVMYVTDDEHYMHVTPFADGGKLNVQVIETQGTADEADDAVSRVTYTPPSINDTALVDFLKQINDPEF